MSPDPVWPSRPAELVLWVQSLAAWAVAAYALAPNTARDGGGARGAARARLRLGAAALVAAAAGWFLPPAGTGLGTRAALAALLAAAVAGTTAGRRWLAGSGRRHRLAEWELGATAALVVASAAVVGAGAVGALPGAAVVRSGKAAALFCLAGAAALLFRGGTYVVRAVLDRAGAAPRVRGGEAEGEAGAAERPVDVPEFNRGRSIGHLERLLMVMVIGLGSYEALGFLIAAKGLIRAREFEDRDFAEYFILGSLASAAVALVVGMALRIAVPHLWGL